MFPGFVTGPNPTTDRYLYKIREIQTQTHGGKTSRDYSDVASSQGMPRIASNHQKPEEAGKSPSLEPSERAEPSQHLDLRLAASGTVREYMSVVEGPSPAKIRMLEGSDYAPSPAPSSPPDAPIRTNHSSRSPLPVVSSPHPIVGGQVFLTPLSSGHPCFLILRV